MPANGINPARTRQQRVAAVELPPGFWARVWVNLRRGSVLVRLALCGVAALVLWLVTQGWGPPFEYHLGMVPERDVLPRVEFKQYDELSTRDARQQARSRTPAVYTHDREELELLRGRLINEVARVVTAPKFEELDPAAWEAFMPPPPPENTQPPPEPASAQQAFEAFKQAFAEGNPEALSLDTLREKLEFAFEPLEEIGLIAALPPDHDAMSANSETITIRPKDRMAAVKQVPVSEVLIENAALLLSQRLRNGLSNDTVTPHVIAWLRPRLPTTLVLDRPATEAAQQLAADAVKPVFRTFSPDASMENMLAARDKPLDEAAMHLLRLEHEAVVQNESIVQKVKRSLATFGMYIALYTLCGYFIFFRQPEILRNLSNLSILLSFVVITTSLAMITSGELAGDKWWQAEMIPLLLFAMTVAIAYGPELSLLLSACVTLIVVMALGEGITDALVLMASTSGAVIVLGRIRSRSKLLTVGLITAVVAALTTVGVGTLAGEPLMPLLGRAGKFALWSIIAGSLMTCLLPSVERVFRVQTDLSLIELGDPAHPLLQELVRRAPGTYNHSINVASLAEAAAEAIVARGLLVRVGAYFHDIGKMLKPGYFVENQSRGDNRHESLVPAMSTLVIIAHVKDGADLARQHKLPQVIIDFIQQHHGTTLVEYFYRRASQQHEADPDSGRVDESSFRYPGPKPQTKEAGILMLSDAVESASRVLVEPTPARIESLVEEITMKRLLDGQFDECGLTLEEVHRVRQSLVKSLTAVYHGRVKYPQPAPAPAKAV
jgi:putative nucleotidyltransferase with HDIG domain